MIRLLLCLLLLANTVEAAQQLVSTTVAPNAATGNDPKTGLPYNPAVVEFADFYQTWLNNQPKINANFAENYGSIGTIATGMAGKADVSGVAIQLGALSDIQNCTSTAHTNCYPYLSAAPVDGTLQAYTAAATDERIADAIAAVNTSSETSTFFTSSNPTVSSSNGRYRNTSTGVISDKNDDWLCIGTGCTSINTVTFTAPSHGSISVSDSDLSSSINCPSTNCTARILNGSVLNNIVATADSGYAFSSWVGGITGAVGEGTITITGNTSGLSATFVGSGGVTFSSEVQAYHIAARTATTAVITLSAGISSGHRVVVTNVNKLGSTGLITSATDSKGNTYAVDKTVTVDGRSVSIVSSIVGASLFTGDTITLVHASGYLDEFGEVFDLGGPQTGVDVTTSNSGYSTIISVPGTTTRSTTVSIGVIPVRTSAYTNSNWTITGTSPATDSSGNYVYSVHNSNVAIGAINPGGSMATTTNWGGVWVAYY